MNSTTETANENFITDQGSMRLRFSRARRGPRPAAEDTVERADRTASETRAAPTEAEPVAAPPPGRCLGPPGCCVGDAPGPLGGPAGRCGAAAGPLAGRAAAAPGAAPLPLVTIGTVAEPLAIDGPPGRFPSDESELVGSSL